MRTKAARVGLDCARLLAAAQAVETRCAAMVYRCPSGSAFRDRVAARQVTLRGLVRELGALQREFLQEAARVEAAEAAWGRLVNAGR